MRKNVKGKQDIICIRLNNLNVSPLSTTRNFEALEKKFQKYLVLLDMSINNTARQLI